MFDSHRPPQQELVEDCVHCGFCLESCPTYVLWAQEADSPRGRIVLIDEQLHSQEPLSPETVSHFDSCLGCMACVTACPSGVRYDRLIERVRPQVERNFARTPQERALKRLIFATLPHPRRMRALAPALAASRHMPLDGLPSRLGNMLRLAPRARLGRSLLTRIPAHKSARGPQRGRVGLLRGCVQRVFYPQVHAATIGVLAAEGFEVYTPAEPECCGALEFHSGEERAAVARAEATIAAFEQLPALDHVVVNAAGCGSAIKEYGDLLGTAKARAFSARVKDVTELLADAAPRAQRHPLQVRAVYHDACHLAHAQGVRAQPRELLRGIPGLELLEVGVEASICCGSAGIYNLLQPEAAAELGERKARNLLATGADVVVAANPGCTAQLDYHLRALAHPLAIQHPVELLWQSLRRTSPRSRPRTWRRSGLA